MPLHDMPRAVAFNNPLQGTTASSACCYMSLYCNGCKHTRKGLCKLTTTAWWFVVPYIHDPKTLTVLTVNACRTPWRLAVWYKQTQDKRILPLLQAQQRFFEGQDLISSGYSLDGKPSQSYTNICFLAPVWCLFKVSFIICLA